MNNICLGMSTSFTMVAKNTGRWALECKVNDHYMAGMKALYDVKVCESNGPKAMTVTGAIRTIFIGIIETEWNYADSDKNVLTGEKLDESYK